MKYELEKVNMLPQAVGFINKACKGVLHYEILTKKLMKKKRLLGYQLNVIEEDRGYHKQQDTLLIEPNTKVFLVNDDYTKTEIDISEVKENQTAVVPVIKYEYKCPYNVKTKTTKEYFINTIKPKYDYLVVQTPKKIPVDTQKKVEAYFKRHAEIADNNVWLTKQRDMRQFHVFKGTDREVFEYIESISPKKYINRRVINFKKSEIFAEVIFIDVKLKAYLMLKLQQNMGLFKKEIPIENTRCKAEPIYGNNAQYIRKETRTYDFTQPVIEFIQYYLKDREQKEYEVALNDKIKELAKQDPEEVLKYLQCKNPKSHTRSA